MAGVFISYRRTDGGGWAGRLRDHLTLRFGPNLVFQDVDDLEKGKITRRSCSRGSNRPTQSLSSSARTG